MKGEPQAAFFETLYLESANFPHLTLQARYELAYFALYHIEASIPYFQGAEEQYCIAGVDCHTHPGFK